MIVDKEPTKITRQPYYFTRTAATPRPAKLSQRFTFAGKLATGRGEKWAKLA